MTRTTISVTREGMQLIQKAARRHGSSVSQFVREAALTRARMATDDNPYPMRALAEQLRAIGDQGYALRTRRSRLPRTRPSASGEAAATTIGSTPRLPLLTTPGFTKSERSDRPVSNSRSLPFRFCGRLERNPVTYSPGGDERGSAQSERLLARQRLAPRRREVALGRRCAREPEGGFGGESARQTAPSDAAIWLLAQHAEILDHRRFGETQGAGPRRTAARRGARNRVERRLVSSRSC